MHWALLGLSALLTIIGFVNVYGATVAPATGSQTMSFAGALIGLAYMLVGAVLAVAARIVQAAEYQGVVLRAMRGEVLELTQPTAEAAAGPVAESAGMMGYEERNVVNTDLDHYLTHGWRLVNRGMPLSLVARGTKALAP